VKIASALRFDAVGHGLDEVRAGERMRHVGHAALIRDDLLCAEGELALSSVGSASTSSRRVRQRLGPPSTPANASIVVRTTLFIGCCAVSDTPAVWVWNRSFIALGSDAPYRSRSSSAQILRAARSFAISSKKSMCALKERQAGRERVDLESARLSQLDVGEAVGQRVGELLRRRRAASRM
jgi:hypothetical protein